jgi:hypothetical protein
MWCSTWGNGIATRNP